MNALEYAIQMEVDGEKFYRKLALENKDNDLNQVFISLAEDERKHAKIIKEKLAGIYSSLEKSDVENEKNIFSNVTGLDPENSVPKQLDVYRMASEMEEKSIELYKKLLSESKEDKDIFELLIKEEEEHYKMIEEIITMVNRPNEWVESAEFGLRKKY